MRAFRAPARIGAPRSLAAQRRLARDDNLTSFLQPEKTKLHHYRHFHSLTAAEKREIEYGCEQLTLAAPRVRKSQSCAKAAHRNRAHPISEKDAQWFIDSAG